MQSQRDYVLRTVEERGIRFVQLWFTDVLGTPKAFNITPAELENALDEGMTFDGSAIDGFSRVQEADVLARPDMKTFQLLPWHGPPRSVARVFCDIFSLDGTPFEGCPRHALRRTLERARAAGYTFFASPEVEYFYFADADPSHRPARSTRGPTSTSRWPTARVTCAGERCSCSRRWASRSSTPSTRTPQSARDRPPLHRRPDHGRHGHDRALGGEGDGPPARACTPRFMPKPLAGVQGSGMHTHLSLWQGERNAFVDPDDPYGLSSVAYRFTAGLLHHAREITAVTNQWVNSYKRLVNGYEAPIHISWARNNRSALVRVPVVKHGKPESTRLEYRAPTAPATRTWPSP